jgi:D-arginine dehydrogenase
MASRTEDADNAVDFIAGGAAVEHYDVCIVGGGIAGASIAYHLDREARVLLLERETHVGSHSTGRSAAVYSPQYGSLLNRRLTAIAGRFLRDPPAGFTATPLLAPRGFLTLGHDVDLDERARALSEAAETGSLLESLTPAEIRSRIPFLRADAVSWGLYDADAQDMDVDAILQGYLRGARAAGTTVLTDAEVLSLSTGSRGWTVVTQKGPCTATIVVNAAGAWADTVGEMAGATPLQIIPHRRTAFVCDVPAQADLSRCPMTVWAGESFYFKPEAGRLLGSLAEENPTTPHDAQPDDLDVAIAVDRIEGVVDFPIHKLIRAWTGLRSFAPDRDPVSGFDVDRPGFYWHAALGGYGIQTSAALGAVAAQRLLDRPLATLYADAGIDYAALSPIRLGVRP